MRYWLVNHVPFLRARGLAVRAGLRNRAPVRLSDKAGRSTPSPQAYNETRRHQAEKLRAGIEGVDGAEVPPLIEGSRPVHRRLVFAGLASQSRRAMGPPDKSSVKILSSVTMLIVIFTYFSYPFVPRPSMRIRSQSERLKFPRRLAHHRCPKRSGRVSARIK